MNTEQETTQEPVSNSPAQDALASWVSERYSCLQRGRWAEARSWYEAGLFDQQKQWLESDGVDSKKLKVIKANNAKMPMPVSNYFSMTIATAANSVGAALPRMTASADNYDAKNRRAALAAEAAIDAANEESGMNILNPILAKHVPLWGMGITKDTVAFDHSTDEIPDIQTPPPTIGPDGQPVEQEPQVVGTQRVPSPRIKTELPTVFEVYVPRECYDANLADIIIERRRVKVSTAKEAYPVYADKFKGEDQPLDDSEGLDAFYHNSLRYLSYVSNINSDADEVTLLDCWCDWNTLSEDIQDEIEKEWKDQPSDIYQSMTKLDAAIEYGIFCTSWKDCVIQWGENPWDGDKPYTFFPWQKDVASPYPRGLSVPLIPLQKQLNRCDSLMERSLMSNASVKLLWPSTQNGPVPNGDPVDVTIYDPLDGKNPPQYFGGHAYGSELIQKREQIVADIAKLGYTNEVAQGEMPSSGTAFRALAYLGSKAEETRKTQRYLWEQAHELRARKILKMARKVWSNPRKVQTAGFNNKWGAQEIQAADLEGDYQLTVQQDSSKPKTLTEKMEVFQSLLEGGFINPNDTSIREYITDTLGVQDLDLTDNLQFTKAERDLELVKNGLKPQSNPYTNWSIHFKTFSDYTFTEEYEELQPEIQAGIMAYCAWLQQMGMAPTGGPTQAPTTGLPHQMANTVNPTTQEAKSKGGVGGTPASHVLGQVPGKGVSTTQAQQASVIEGNQLVPQDVGAN